MSCPSFLADHDFNDHIVRGVLRKEPGVDFRRARDVGLDASSDKQILDFATTENLIVVSHDVATMVAEAISRFERGSSIAGLLLAHQRSAVATIIDDLILIWAASERQEWIDQVRFLPL